MNSVNFKDFKLTLDVEKRFCKIYGSVIFNYFTFNEELLSHTEKVLNSREEGDGFETDLHSKQLAFMLTHSVQDTCLSVTAILTSLVSYSKIIKELPKNNQINMLCLECESLPTVFGICQVIDEIVEKFSCACQFDYFEIQVLVIEERQNWRSLCECLVETVNSYFQRIELKLNFVDDFENWTVRNVGDRILECDLLIVARYLEKHQVYPNSLKVILKKMKENATFFWFDCCNEEHYNYHRRVIKYTRSFSKVSESSRLCSSFEKLADEHCLDLAINWVTDPKVVMFSVWVKITNQPPKRQKKSKS